jgi:DNA-binding transcriptional MerR regulator
MLITIGALARASGLTPSALRFYGDCGLLVPAEVDPVTGYRYYDEAQRERAVLIRKLREIEVPLETVTRILDGDPDLLDEHVRDLRRRARAAAAAAGEIKRLLAPAVSAKTLAEAIDQVLPAAATGGEIPVLTGVLVGLAPDAITLTATDRYRLTTRTLAARHQSTGAATMGRAEIERARSWLHRHDEVALALHGDGFLLTAGKDEHRCRTMAEEFPDYRLMLSALAPPRKRVVEKRADLLDAVETAPGARIHLDSIGLTFERATLRAAVVTAVGPDLLLEVSTPDQPVVVRSATDGDLTTLAMPVGGAHD